MEDYELPIPAEELPIPAEELARLTLGENCDQETFDDFVTALGGDDY